MNRRPVILIVLLAVLAAGYAWFVLRPAAVPIAVLMVQPPGAPPSFAFDRGLTLAEVRVHAVDAADAGAAPPVWHLVSDPDAGKPPQPLRTFPYGRPIRGLAPAAGSGDPEALKPGQAYRLSGRAGAGTFVLDFVAR